MLKANASGLPVDATNTDAAVAAAVTASHAALTLGDAAIQAVFDLSTQALTLDTQAAKTALMGPESGAAADPTFRALANADIPTDTDTYNDTAAKNLGTDADGGYRADHAEFGNVTGAAEGQIAVAKSIIFPAVQVADAGANVLDDYEEGAWDPTYVSTNNTFTYEIQNGAYVKIGRTVWCNFRLKTATATINTAASVVSIGGLPFAISADADVSGGFPLGYASTFAANWPFGLFILSQAIYLNGRAASNGETTNTIGSDMKLTAGNQIFGSFWYYI
jgi:hypothetical protein